MRRKLLTLDIISNNKKINQIFSHEININKKIKKVTSLDTNMESLSDMLPDTDDVLSVLGNVRHYRFKYIFIPPRGDNVVVNSANLMQFGFLYSKKEEYEQYFQNPNYSLLIYTPIFQDYYLKVEQIIYANVIEKHLPIITFYISNVNEEKPLIVGEISSVFKETNYTMMKEYYLQNCYEKDIKNHCWNVSDYKLKKLLNNKSEQSTYFREYFYPYHKEDFKCKYWWQDVNKKHFVILNKVNKEIDSQLNKKLQSSMQKKIDKVLSTLAATLLIKKLI